MKSPLAVLLVLVTLSVSTVGAAEPPKGFSGIPWGASMEAAKKVFSERPELHLIKETPTSLFYFGGDFIGIRVERWELNFADGAFYRGIAYLNMPDGTSVDGIPNYNSQFDDMAALYMAKYGEGKRTTTGDHVVQEWKFDGEKDAPSYKIILRFKWFDQRQFFIQYEQKTPRSQPGPDGKTLDEI